MSGAEQALSLDDDMAEPVLEVQRGHLKPQDGHWCKEILAYSPGNPSDRPETRVKLYTAGRLSEALDWAERGVVEWRTAALEARGEVRRLAAVNRIAIEHLRRVLQDTQARIPAEQRLQWRIDAENWLTSIGSEPT